MSDSQQKSEIPICPILTGVSSETKCYRERCAWWNAHFHKCACAVLPSSGNP